LTSKNEPMKLSKPSFLKMSPSDPMYRTQGPTRTDFMNYWCKLHDIQKHLLEKIIDPKVGDFPNATLWAKAVEKDLTTKITAYTEKI
jgi:hypothetical protein